MENKCVGVIGASSFVGLHLLNTLTQSGWRVIAFSRHAKQNIESNLEWRCISTLTNSSHSPTEVEEEIIPIWICAAPIWVLPDYFDLLKSHGATRVLALSSTSRFTKGDSSDLAEQAVANRLIDAEARLQSWAEESGIEWIIMRPTLIYGLGKDKNVSEIMRLIRRWRFFPILGKGQGLRQPVHVEDVAKICEIATTSSAIKNRAYNLSGGETLSYKEMVKRIFIAIDKKPRFVHLPRWAFRLVLLGLRYLPRFRQWSVAMADRMDRDLVFDNKDVIADFGFSPRPFLLDKNDLL